MEGKKKISSFCFEQQKFFIFLMSKLKKKKENMTVTME